MSVVYLDGEWVPAERATIPAADPGLLYGDAVFETARLAAGRYFRLDEHLARLQTGAAVLRMPLPPPAELEQIARELVRRNDVADGSLRITVTRGAGGRTGTVLATLSPLPAGWREEAERGWRIVTAEVRHPPASCLPAVKTPGRAYGLVARLDARAADADDALLLSPSGEVTEGPSWNVFWRKGVRLFTPALELGVLAGVTRAAVLEVAAEAGTEAVEGRFPRAELDDAEEIFATMTSRGIVAFATLDGRELPEGRRVASRRLGDLYWALVEREAR